MHGYVKSIPIELEEAAVIDGATRTEVIFKVIMPLLLPAIGASALRFFLGTSQYGSNVAIGKSSLQNFASGGYNVAIGVCSLYSNISSGFNVAVGHKT
jgi:ABC-type maltose transport system permease subunit